MTEIRSCRPSYPARKEERGPEVMIDIAAHRAKVDRRCNAVPMRGNSYEQERIAQKEASGKLQGVLPKDRKELVENAQGLADGVKSLVKEFYAVPAKGARFVLEKVWEKAIVEGEKLDEALVRDAKVLTLVTLAKADLPAGFVEAASKARARSAGGATRILGEIDKTPGFRASLEKKVRTEVRAAMAGAAASGLKSEADVLAKSKSDESFANKLATDFVFRLAIHAALYRANTEKP